MALIFCLLFLARGLAQEVTTPSALLGPRTFNYHPIASNYLQSLGSPATTKKGPVLFPNDAPPPPRPPLIVTSRPLVESIARSELNPDPQNNTLPQSSQVNNVIRPYLARVKDYRPFHLATPAPDYDYQSYRSEGRAGYEDYEQKPVLPPIYKVIADHAKQKVAKIKEQRNKNRYEYQVQKGPEYYYQPKNKNENNGDDEEGKNYAFSYRVNDKETGDDFSHTQRSSGSATNGEYRVRLPDGRMQIVSYTADENGYHADVRYADDDVKATNKNINNRNEDRYDYNHKQFNDNHNSIDYNNFNDNHDNIDTDNQYNVYNPDKYNDKIEYKHDYAQQRDYKTDNIDKYRSPVSNDYYNQYTDSDSSKDYYNDDLSKEYDYEPYKSKYTSFIPTQNTAFAVPKVSFVPSSTVKPSYGELKDLLVTKKAYNTVQPYNTRIPVTISVPSTTPSSTFEGTTERVVLIGGKKSNFYTNINNVPLVSTAPAVVTPAPVRFVTPTVTTGFSASPTSVSYVTPGVTTFEASPTPMNYLVSTINSLRNKEVDLSGPKPVLSSSYIDRINKYLRFN